MAQVRIISIENPEPLKQHAPDLSPSHHQHSKFVLRRKYVEQVLLPQMQNLQIGTVKIFPAITPRNFTTIYEEGKIFGKYEDYKIQVHFGCFGNFMSNFIIWKECISIDEPILILEDDALLPLANQEIIVNAIRKYEQQHFDENAILYLLSQIPSQPTQLHDYYGKMQHKNLIRLIDTADLSGTAAYCVNPFSARTLIDRAVKNGMLPTDGFIHTAQKERTLDVLFPVEYKKCFMLNDHFAAWNHVHDPNIS